MSTGCLCHLHTIWFCPVVLKQLGLATRNFHDANNKLPAMLGNSCCWGTWAIVIMPFIEQDNAAVRNRSRGLIAGRLAGSAWSRRFVCNGRNPANP
ncbi:DUF1559 domain-containing protein [Gemmata algarum]|uniref:DUF1559 family PulG-like putative transporter n=1 Tax=Gemmata algarum TaxID=2975278 RepID=UPI0039C99AC1